MSRKVLDSNISDADIDFVMNNIIAQNPQLNAQIEQVRNESNVFLCKISRIYPYEDKAWVRILDTNEKIFCRLSHEVLGSGMCIDYLPNGEEVIDRTMFVGKKYVKPFDNLFGIVIKVRWENLKDENVLLGYVNIHDRNNLKSSNDTGEISIKSESSILSVDNERINIMTPALFINGLPYEAPELENYYNKKESDLITDNLNMKIDGKSDKNHVHQWKTIQITNGVIKYNSNLRICVLNYSKTMDAISKSNENILLESINITNYAPPSIISVSSSIEGVTLHLNSDGKLSYTSNTEYTNKNIIGYFMWVY